MGHAEIDDGTLTVQVAGASSKSWKARLETVLALLDTAHSGWVEVSLTKRAIRVSGVQHGSEAELRHFLESAVLQANTDTAPPPHEEEGEESDADEQMAHAFRSFASEHHHR